MIVAIAGATGLTGGLCLQELLHNEHISKVYSIGRRQTGLKHSKLEEIPLQNNRVSEVIHADAFICCLGTTIKKAGSKNAFKAIDLELPVYLAKELNNKGCNTVSIISSMGAKASSSIFYSSVKGQMEEAVKQINFKSLSILRPSIIAGQRNEKRFGEKIGLVVMKVMNPLLIGSLKNYKSIRASDIAKALVNSAIIQKSGTTVYLSDEIKKLASVKN
jgi:uncharacterized protein YbjT (DUF2867 family)